MPIEMNALPGEIEKVEGVVTSPMTPAHPASSTTPRRTPWGVLSRTRVTPKQSNCHKGTMCFCPSPRDCCPQLDVETSAACVICLEDVSPDDKIEDDVLPFTVPEFTVLPCDCQKNVGKPAQVHEACLRQWLRACQRRAANEYEVRITCPLCRAPLSEAVSKSLEITLRARAALAQCPQLFAMSALTSVDGTIKSIVKVNDKARRIDPGNPRLLSLFIEGVDPEKPLLVARAPKIFGSVRLATKFDILYCDHEGKETPIASVSRNTLGTRWIIDHSGKASATVEYETNRFANRPRAMRVDIGDSSFLSRQPEYSPRLGGYCLDFYGRAKLASVRNFQLVDPKTGPLRTGDEEERALLLFGRWSEDEFHLDVKAPFSIVDAFAIAVSSFATKLACI